MPHLVPARTTRLQPSPTAATFVACESFELLPSPRIWWRAAAAALLCGLIFIGTASTGMKLGACLVSILCLGSFVRTRVTDGRLQRSTFIGFVPRNQNWSLERFVRIDTDWSSDSFLGSVFFLGPVLYLWFQFFDRLFPWFGGPYKLWLRAASGKRVLVWQGCSEANFQANLELLKMHLRLPIHRR